MPIHCRWLLASLLAGTMAFIMTGLADGQAEALPPAATNAFGLSAPKPRPARTVRLATYNLLNLFDHVDDPALSGEFDDLPMATAETRCRQLAEHIIKMDADIIACQEIESLDCLTWFRDTYLKDAGYDHIASKDVGYYRGVECSILSRFPIIETKVWLNESLDSVRREGPGWSEIPEGEGDGMTFQRSPLMARIKVSDDYELTVFSVHHKSGRSFRWKREFEAARIVDFLNAMITSDPARNIVVMGDFNAAPWDKSVRLYTAAGFVDTLSHRIIPRWRNPDETEANLYKTHESARTIDYILMNPAVYREVVRGSAHVYGTLTPPESYDWRKDPHPNGYASDHYPVVIDIMPNDRP